MIKIKNFLPWQIPLIDRYVLKELSLLFLFTLGLLSSLGVAIGTVSDLAYKITEYELPVAVAVLIFGYKIPEYVAYALPICLLLTSLIIYGRLNSDRELVALRSAGISPGRIVIPALGFGLMVTGITFLFNESIVPDANYQANLLQTPFIAQTELNLQKNDLFYLEYESNRQHSSAKKLKKIYFAEKYQSPSLKRVTIICFKREKISQIITAKSAQWNQQSQAWDLVEGKIDLVNDDIYSAPGILTEKFTRKQLPLGATIFEIAQKGRSPDEMNIRQAKEYLNLIKDTAKKTDIAKFSVRIKQKYAFPFICLVFALIGSVLGIKYSQINRAKGFGICVAIVFIYYFLGFTLGSLGISGILSPFWAAWTPNILGLMTGGWLLITVDKSA